MASNDRPQTNLGGNNVNGAVPSSLNDLSAALSAGSPFALTQAVAAVAAAAAQNRGACQTPNDTQPPSSSSTQSQILPSSAPVSSLLPPVPAQHQQPKPAPPLAGAALQTQLAAFLNAGTMNGSQASSTLALHHHPQPQQTTNHGTNASSRLQQNHSFMHQLASTGEHPSSDAKKPLPAAGYTAASHLLRSAGVGLHHQSPSPAASSVAATAAMLPAMQSWPLERLEQHVAMLQQLNQPIPQAVAVLLAESRRREEKKHAKREANRRSASTSRQRKKALVQEMTEMNARLRRQALILSLLPDLVIVISVEGKITFCSAQVERVLRYKIDDLINSPLVDILVPASKDKLRRLIKDLVESEDAKASKSETATAGCCASAPDVTATGKNKSLKRPRTDDEGNNGGDNLAAPIKKQNEKPGKSGSAAFVSNEKPSSNSTSGQSFPPSVVKVEGKARALDENNNSDTSTSNPGSKEPSSLTNSASLTRSPTASSLCNSGSDDGVRGGAAKEAAAATGIGGGKKKSAAALQKEHSSDNSNSSSLSTDAKKLRNANANLERNVRWHNMKMKDKVLMAQVRAGYKDDVTGAAVTANNATARLSSLQHHPETSSSEEDSGYRESNESREESSSFASDSSESNGRRKPLAPTCNVCLVRADLTTVWCEVTSSIRTRDLKSESEEGSALDIKPAAKKTAKPATKKVLPGSAKTTVRNNISELCNLGSDGDASLNEEVKEILLCVRPISDGEEKTGDKYKLALGPVKKDEQQLISESSNDGPSGEVALGDSLGRKQSSRPPKKRIRPHNDGSNRASGAKRKRAQDSKGDNGGTRKATTPEDNDVVESLMLMSNKPT